MFGKNSVGYNFAKNPSVSKNWEFFNKIVEGLYMQYSLALQDAQIMGEKIGEERGKKRGEKNLIFDMFRNNKTVDEIANFINHEKSKIFEYKKEFDQINTQL